MHSVCRVLSVAGCQLAVVCCMMSVACCLSRVVCRVLSVAGCQRAAVALRAAIATYLRGRIPVRGRLDDEAGEHARLLLREQEAAERPLLLTGGAAQTAHGSVSSYSRIAHTGKGRALTPAQRRRARPDAVKGIPPRRAADDAICAGTRPHLRRDSTTSAPGLGHRDASGNRFRLNSNGLGRGGRKGGEGYGHLDLGKHRQLLL